MRRAAALAALALLAGCGAQSPDLFAVTQSGKGPNADVRLVVSDDGTVTCNRLKPRQLPDGKLLEARQLARDLGKQAALSISLPAERNSILRYVVSTADGRVAFSDTSRGKPATFDRVIAFTHEVVEGVCGISR